MDRVRAAGGAGVRRCYPHHRTSEHLDAAVVRSGQHHHAIIANYDVRIGGGGGHIEYARSRLRIVANQRIACRPADHHVQSGVAEDRIGPT